MTPSPAWRSLLSGSRRTAGDRPVLPLVSSRNRVLVRLRAVPLPRNLPKPHAGRERPGPELRLRVVMPGSVCLGTAQGLNHKLTDGNGVRQERPLLTPDLAGAVAQAGITSTTGADVPAITALASCS
jgi:hypothetical protein